MIIIHGDNQLQSSNRLTALTEEIKTKGFKVSIYDQSEVSVGLLRQELSNTDLFGESNYLLIKGLLSGAKSKNKDKVIEYLKESSSEKLLLYETKTVHAATLKQFKGATVEGFKVDINVFKFLEKVVPNNLPVIISGYKDLIDRGAEPEFIFAMLVRQLRLLIQFQTSPKLLKLAPFSLRLLQYQSQKYTIDKLLSMHQNLYLIEKGIKSGTKPLDLNNLLIHFFEQI